MRDGSAKIADFATRLLHWFDRHGRHDLPWQHPREPYRVWLSEIMLQQTQVSTVIPFFRRFLARFPDVRSLAQAPLDDVLAHWAGLGYYARARNLHRCAQMIVERHGGEFPRDLEALTDLPGIGRSTAGAILAQAFGQRHAILDGNVRRVLARHAAIAGWPGQPAVQNKLWTLSERLLPRERLADYTQAIMDLGATVCSSRKPACGICPLRDDCAARLEGRVLDYPGAKPRRAHPQRRTWMLVIENAGGEILCERRPPAGIWGGLWCLPMTEASQDWPAYCRTRFGLHCSPASPLPAMRHGFTHFDLEILPLRLRMLAADDTIREGSDLAWIKMSASPAVGLPAPVRKLLESPNLNLDRLQCPGPSTA
ncbi:MAG: A/G-specific adenine glycosylase [Nevskiaceae bacterium]|nr:MAG: A/G-specific adenine glycosylase [Nevskiaceae bacterium]